EPGALPPLEGLDPAIADYVNLLRAGGVETFESCQGGAGHADVEPVVRFFGDKSEGFRALDLALRSGLPVLDLRRFWQGIDGGPCGPYWELAFREPATPGACSGRTAEARQCPEPGCTTRCCSPPCRGCCCDARSYRGASSETVRP